jgi:di/tricarboxylate transporter
MTFEQIYTLAVIGVVIIGLVSHRIGIDAVMIGGLVLLILGGVIDPATGLAGFSNPAVLMVAGLFIVASATRETGAVESLAGRLLGHPTTPGGAQARMMAPVSLMSGVLNTTPVVAMCLPVINDWSKRLGLSPSKLFLPLSFAGILGGQLTVIGTASNLIVMSAFVTWAATTPSAEVPSNGFQFWGIAVVGVPAVVLGILVTVLGSRWLLPMRKPAGLQTPDDRRYHVEMVVGEGSPVIGQSIEEAGLRRLPGLYLTHIDRGDRMIPAVGPDEIIHIGDSLGFVGILESVIDLRRIRGLEPEADQVDKVAVETGSRVLVEAVISGSSSLANKSIRDGRFRTIYNAAIIAVHRGGQQIHSKIGDIVLRSGDTLLLETDNRFVKTHRNCNDFYLISQVEDSRAPRHRHAPIVLTILAVMVVLLTTGWVDRVVAVWACALAMVATRCLNWSVARSGIQWQVVLAIAAALGIGAAVQESGLATMVASGLQTTAQGLGMGGPGSLLAIFLAAVILAQVITNYGAAAVVFPIAMHSATQLGASPTPFVLAVMAGAGCNLLSPVSYQTNMMVSGPGGYRFLDYARLGGPILIGIGIIVTFLVPLVFPLFPTS